MLAIGVDPGKSGALAVIYTDEKNEPFRIKVVPFDAWMYREVLDTLVDDDRVVCCVEKVGAMPGQGVVSMFNFGHNFGFIEGMLHSRRIPYQLVPPQTWKKEFSLSSDKQASIDVCKKLFPDISLLATTRSRKDSDGMAEALLMAEYARRRL